MSDDWKKRFDEIYGPPHEKPVPHSSLGAYDQLNAIKSFIEEVLAAAKKEEREKIRKMSVEITKYKMGSKGWLRAMYAVQEYVHGIKPPKEH